MDPDQVRAVELARSGKSFFLTGAGGTGKSYVIRNILDALRRDQKDVALTAMTGCAALLLGKGAKTLHSWAGIGLGKDTAQTLIVKIRTSKAKKNWLSADVLVIDEVSMMTPDMLDKLDLIGQGIRKSKTPFGGLQIILVGDMYQLPTVNRLNDGHHFVFEAETWRKCIQDSVVLRTVHRQSDPVFLKILYEARAGRLSQESIEILETRRNNSWKKLDIKPTLLFTRRADVEEINMTQLQKCHGPDVVFKVKTIKSDTAFMNTEQIIQYAVEKMDKNGSYVPELILRKGAQVMLLTNQLPKDKSELEAEIREIEWRKRLDDDITESEWKRMKKELKDDAMRRFDSIGRGLVNGSRGVIQGFSGNEGYPVVKFRNGDIHTIKPNKWSSEDIPGLEREQIPLRLAYAITIHKAQGATLDCALIDIGDNTFEFGQAYVALSRVKSLDCLYIWDLEPTAFRVHPKVKAFLDTVNSLDTTCPIPDPTDDHTEVSTSSQIILRSPPCTEANAADNDDPSCS
jgi:ATP-dependent DNA helicase PIF1